MKLENRFTVPVPRADAWKVLLDVERIAPCMPGATLTEHSGDDFSGTVKVKVGPINLTYGGKASFVSLDEAAGVAVIEGSGKETRGSGTAKAVVTCRLVDNGASTDVEVDTDLNVTGKPASFGRGVLADVSAKLVDQFAACLSKEILAAGADPSGTVAGDGSPNGAPEAARPTATSPAPTPHATTVPAGQISPAASDGGAAATPHRSTPRAARDVEPINLLDTAGAPLLKRLAPVLAALLVAVLLGRRLRR